MFCSFSCNILSNKGVYFTSNRKILFLIRVIAVINKLGFYQDAKQIPSPFYNERPSDCDPSLLVIHCISLPEGHYGGREIEQLFTGCLDCSADPSFIDLVGLEVSAHCVIRRDGVIEQVGSIVEQCGLQQFAHEILFSGRCFKQRGAIYAPPQQAYNQVEILTNG